MTLSATAYLALPDTQARQIWLSNHAPNPNPELITTLQQLALHQVRDNPQATFSIAEAVADAATLWQDRQTRAVSLHIEANAYQLLAKPKQALGLYEEASALYRSLDMELEAARVAVGQFATLQYLGHHEEALTLARWASDVFQVAGDQVALGKMLMNQGNIYARLGQFAEARTHYAQARTIFQDNNNFRHLAMLDVNDAIALTYLDDFREAENLYQSARSFFAEQDIANLVAHIDVNLSHLYFAQGDYQHALQTLNQARQVYLAQDSAIHQASIDLHRSDNYLALNLWQEALETAQTARASFAEAGMPWETAVLWLNEALAQAHLPQQSTAEEAWEQARQQFQQAGNELWLAMTDLYQATIDIRAGNYAAARTKAQQARSVFNQNKLRGRTAHCNVLLGEAALQANDLPQAIYHFQQAQEHLDNADIPAVAYACSFGLGQTAVIQGNITQAYSYFQQAITHIERLQAAIGAEDYKIAFFSDKLHVYEAMVQLCLTQQSPPAIAAAFEASEQAKSRALLDVLARGNAPSDNQTESNLTAQINRLKQELNWYYNRLNAPQPDTIPLTPQQIGDMTDAISRRERALRKLIKQWRSPDLASVPYNPIWTVTLPQIQPLLSDNTLLLSYFFAEDQLFVFGISQDETWTMPLDITESSIAPVMADLHFQFNKFLYGAAYQRRHIDSMQRMTDEALAKLHNMLIAPLTDHIQNTDSLIIVPHRSLHAVPFHALFDGEQYLIEQHPISYAPSATILYRTLTMKTAVSPTPPLIIGIDDAIIPQARAEAESLAQLFPEAHVYLGDDATTHQLTQATGTPAFLHISTHAAFRADNYLFSTLKLADGWINVNDIYNLVINPPLVTLSACETGLTNASVGDEIEGLCRGFFATGAQTILMSLWMVDDVTTAQLMTHFYQNLLSGLPATNALRTAQLQIKQENPHPFYWATFILTGNFNLKLYPS